MMIPRNLPKRVSDFVDYARLLWTEATSGPNAINEARRREREAIVRWLRDQSELTSSHNTLGYAPSAQVALTRASNLIAGGAHYR